MGATLLALSPSVWAAGRSGGGGGFSGGGFAGGHPGAGSGGVRSAGPRFSAGPRSSASPGYYYSRGTRFMGFRAGQLRSPVPGSESFANPNHTVTNSGPRPARTSERPTLNGRTDHIAERHNSIWHTDWDRRHAHFFHHRFFVFDDGFWFGLDDGFFPWDYYPYSAYDYYPYDYYPGYYADVEPYYYDQGVYSGTPMRDPTVNAVQTQLTQLGYYNG